MDIEQVKQAFIKADDLAQKGDPQAKEDAAYFANYIKNYKPEQKTDTSHNWKGAAAGLYDLGRSAVIDFPLQAGMAVGSLIRGEPAAVARRSSQEAVKDATEGLRAENISPDATASDTYKYMMWPFEKMGQGLEWLGDKAGEITGNKDIGEGTKIALDIGTAVAPIPGTKLAGKALIKGAEKLDPGIRKQKYEKPVDLTPEQQKVMQARNEEVYRQQYQDRGEVYPGDKQKEMGIPERVPMEPIQSSPLFPEGTELDASQARNPFEQPKGRQESLFDEDNLAKQQAEENARATDYQARREEFGPDRNPQDLALDYDPFGLKDLEKSTESPKPAPEGLDYSTLPETVNKDYVLQNQLQRFEKLKARLGEVAAKELTLKQDEGPSYYPNTEINEKFQKEFKKEQDKLQKNIENLKKEIDTRLRNEHGWSYPSLEGPKQPYSRSIYTRQRGQAFKTPDMQRSPDANITGADKIVKTNPHPLGGVGKKQGGAIDPGVFGEGIAKLLAAGKSAGKFGAGVAKSMVQEDRNTPKMKTLSGQDKIHAITGSDGRDVKTFVSDFIKNKDQFTDLPDAASLKGIGVKDLTPSAVGKLTYNRNPVISYMSHQYDKIDGMIRHAKEEALWGLKSGLSSIRGLPTKVKSDAGARTIMKTLPKARREGFRSTVVKYMDGKILEEMGLPDATDGMLMADGLNAREIQAYRAARAQFDKVVDIINDMRTKAGMDPIAKRPGYFPSIWMGDWRVFVKDAKGETIQVLAFDNKMEVDMAVADIKKADPTLVVDPVDARKNRYHLKDLSAFQLASEVFGKNTPQTKLLEQIRNDILKRRGFMKHSIQKKGVEGFMGSKEGGFKDMERAIDIYLEQAYNYIGDMQKKNLLGELHAEMEKNKYSLAQDKPNTNKYLSDITANSIGAVKNMLEGVDSVVEFFGEFVANKTGIGGRSSGKHLVRTINGLASFWNLATAKQFVINAMQPLYALPKARQLALTLGTEGLTKNMLLSYMEAFVPGQLSKESRAALEFARDSGMIDARMLEMVNANTGQAAALPTKVAGHAASWWEQEAVRVPAFLFYNKMLKDVISNPKERYAAAAQMTADTMVNYSKTQTPAIYSQMGLAGEVLRPYQQYSHNYHGQLAEYVNAAKRDKQLTPLAGFLGVQTMTAGLRGLVPLATATGIINIINTWSDDPIPTPEEYLLSSGMSDMWVLGPMSKFTGMDLSSSAGAPSLLAAPGMPGVSFAKNMIQDVGGYAVDKMRGMATGPQEMQAAMTATPSAGKGITELMYADEQGRIPNPRRNMQPDMPGPRTTKGHMIRIGMGATPYEEGAQKARIRGAEATIKKEAAKKAELLEKIADDFVSKKTLNKELVTKYAKLIGPDTTNKIQSAIESKIKDRIFSRAQSMILNASGMDQVTKMKKIEEFQVELQNASMEDVEDLNRQLK